jgi:hypothetical protein
MSQDQTNQHLHCGEVEIAIGANADDKVTQMTKVKAGTGFHVRAQYGAFAVIMDGLGVRMGRLVEEPDGHVRSLDHELELDQETGAPKLYLEKDLGLPAPMKVKYRNGSGVVIGCEGVRIVRLVVRDKHGMTVLNSSLSELRSRDLRHGRDFELKPDGSIEFGKMGTKRLTGKRFQITRLHCGDSNLLNGHVAYLKPERKSKFVLITNQDDLGSDDLEKTVQPELLNSPRGCLAPGELLMLPG